SSGLAAWLVGQDIGRGSRVALLLQNTPHFMIAMLGIWKIGAIPVPCNPMYRAPELADLFADFSPAAVICHGDLAEVVTDALAFAGLRAALAVANPRDWQRTNDERVLPGLRSSPTPAAGSDFIALCLAGEGAVRIADLYPDDTGLILYTSGTTGKPKGAVLNHASIVFNSEACARWMGLGSTSRILALAPLFHITGLILHMGIAIAAGCSIGLNYRFHPEVALGMVRTYRPTFTIAAITAFNALMGLSDVGPADFKCFEAVYTGGAPVAPALRDQVRRGLGIDLLPAYGMTESCAPTHLAPRGREPPVDNLTGALAVGLPITSTDARICGPAGETLSPGEAGEIWMRGPQVMTGYWNNPAETAETLVDGWLRSGDVGIMDAEGWFYVVDRQKDMINASGFKVWPRQVEDVLLAHPAVREAAVVGEPDAYRGETVRAYISVRESGPTPTCDDLVAFCRARLAAYKVPRRITILDELPKTITGKIQRSRLRTDQPDQGGD
ncbi:MAG TPA: AMP-binding protein, partial [Sphingomonas sp.]|nr:AMP-binding protein [Sphingomonas sp.]